MVIIHAFINIFFESAPHDYLAQCNSMKLVANVHKLCYEACMETKMNYCIWLSIVAMHYDDHVHHMHYFY